jgi:hypothetical protein
LVYFFLYAFLDSYSFWIFKKSLQEEEGGERQQELAGLLSLLRKYLHHLCTHVLDLLPAATAVVAAARGGAQRYFLAVAGLLGQEGLVGALLPELAVCLLLLQVPYVHADPEPEPDPKLPLKVGSGSEKNHSGSTTSFKYYCICLFWDEA